MREIWKFELEDVRHRVEAPGLQRIVHYGMQVWPVPFGESGEVIVPHVWVEVDGEGPMRGCDVKVFATGQIIDEEFVTYVGTVIVEPYVWHLYATKIEDV